MTIRPGLPSFTGSPFANLVDSGELDRRILDRVADEHAHVRIGTYTPAWTATTTDPAIGNGSITGRYALMGPLFWFHARIVMGSTTTFGSGLWRVGLPVTADTNVLAPIVSVQVRDSSPANEWSGTGRVSSGGGRVEAIAVTTDTTDGRINDTHPITWADGDSLWVTGTLLRVI